MKRWWRRFFVEEAYIPDEVRSTCERYGEQVIINLLAGSRIPIGSAELADIFNNPLMREHARAWLAEEISYTDRRDHWISLRDFILEIAIVLLILWEIHLSNQQEQRQSANFAQQQKEQKANFDAQQGVLSGMLDTLGKLKTSIDILNQTSADQRDIVKGEHNERVKKANERPELQMWAYTKPFRYVGARSIIFQDETPPMGPTPPEVPEQQKLLFRRRPGDPTVVTFGFYVRNIGNSSANNVTVSTIRPLGIGERCLVFPSERLSDSLGQHEDCPPKSTSPMFPIKPRPKNRPSEGQNFEFDSDVGATVSLVVPVNVQDFAIVVVLKADGADPVRKVVNIAFTEGY